MNSRTSILDALRQGLAAAPLTPDPGPAMPASAPVGPDAWERLAVHYAPLGVRLRLAATPEEAAKLVADTARERKAETYVRWDDFPHGLAEQIDAALSDAGGPGGLTRLDAAKRDDLARAHMGVTGAHAAFLDSGSVALVAAPGRQRAVSLLPPLHVCLVPRSAIAPDPSAMPGLLKSFRDESGLPSCLNFITGPSSTADIELVLVRGVHGPGSLEVIGLDWL
jgi:L-lactate dehydrogenase complex protein LldG